MDSCGLVSLLGDWPACGDFGKWFSAAMRLVLQLVTSELPASFWLNSSECEDSLPVIIE